MDKPKSKTILVTGSSRGIGKAIVELAYRKNYQIVMHGKSDSDELNEVHKKLKGSLKVYFDISNEKETDKAIEELLERIEKVDILVNNAGIAYYIPFSEMSTEKWQKTINVNLNGTYFVTKYLLPAMEKSSSPVIANITSGAAVDSWPEFSCNSRKNQASATPMAAYIASKYAIRGFLRALANEYRNISMFNFSPGLVKTNMTEKYFSNLAEDYFYNPSDVASYIFPYLNGEKTFRSGQDIVMLRKDKEPVSKPRKTGPVSPFPQASHPSGLRVLKLVQKTF